MTQREIFLQSEADAWYARNEEALARRDWGRDPVVRHVDSIAAGAHLSVLEVGCAAGARLEYLRAAGHEVAGVEPSRRAVYSAKSRGLNVCRGVANNLPFTANTFDVVIYGFCLYLTDDADLFSIAAEGARVLKDSGWTIVLDFDTDEPIYRKYHHADGVFSRKMSYASMFTWHPTFTLAAFEKTHHSQGGWTDDPQEWVGVSVIRKHTPEGHRGR